MLAFTVITSVTVEPLGPRGTPPIDTPRHRALGSESRVTILRLVRDAAGGLTAGDVSSYTGQHLSTTRAHLEQLTEAGLLVKARASGGQPGRPAWRYRAPESDPTPAPYRALAAALLEHLPHKRDDMRVAAGLIGRDWGKKLAAGAPPTATPVETVTAVLAGLGFSPTPRPGTDEIHLRTCPFLDLVGQNPDAMCGLHAGVVRGVLETRGLKGEDTVLEPFGAPHACIVRLPSSSRPTAPTRSAARRR
jgi:predicted ArsR family transcriptional regulator